MTSQNNHTCGSSDGATQFQEMCVIWPAPSAPLVNPYLILVYWPDTITVVTSTIDISSSYLSGCCQQRWQVWWWCWSADIHMWGYCLIIWYCISGYCENVSVSDLSCFCLDFRYIWRCEIAQSHETHVRVMVIWCMQMWGNGDHLMHTCGRLLCHLILYT